MNDLKPNTRVPWHNDYPLDVGQVAAILAADLSEMTDARVATLGEGWDFSTYLVNDEWVFRFPKRRQCVRALAREIKALDALGAALTHAEIAVPRYRYHVLMPTTFALPYAGYSMLWGEPLLDYTTDAIDRVDLGAQLGDFLRRLESIRPSPPPRNYHDDLPSHIVDFRRELEEVAPVFPSDITDACRRLLGKSPPPFSGPPLFQHGDLGAEHILVDPDRGRVVAIIDWGDAGWGNPVADVVGLWAWGGDAAVLATLRSWQRTFTEQDWLRLRFWGASYAIGSAYFGYKDGRDALYTIALGWLERMHQAGQLADPGTPDG